MLKSWRLGTLLGFPVEVNLSFVLLLALVYFAFGGAIGVLLVAMYKKVQVWRVLEVSAPALAAAYSVGRAGCWAVGDDYGRPTDLPWGVAFPQGLPPTTLRVHPTQLYEAGAELLILLASHGFLRQGRPVR